MEKLALTLSGLLAKVASDFPDRRAISACGKFDLTHARLQELVDHAAALLAASGVGAGDVVALTFPNTVEFVIMFLAVIRCRATAAPLNSAYTAEEFEFYLADSGSKLLLTPQEGNERAQSAASKLNIPHLNAKLHSAGSKISLSSTDVELSPTTMSEVVNDPLDVTLFLHDSGITDLPKGLPLTQLNLASFVQRTKSENSLTESDSTVISHPLFHVYGLGFQLLSSLAAGATVVLTPDVAIGRSSPSIFMADMFSSRAISTGNSTDTFESLFGPRAFSYQELLEGTGFFAASRIVGRGGSGDVYVGQIGDAHTQVAVKKIRSDSAQGKKEFLSELMALSLFRHPNLVRLIGYCRETNQVALVYEFMRGGTLDHHLFNKDGPVLPWEKRVTIARGLASALHYLHEGREIYAVHRDIKCSNVILDEELKAKLADFGIARLVDRARGPKTTQLMGTWGYMPRECFETSKASKETDVFGFGVVLLEMGSGKRVGDPKGDQKELVEWIWKKYGRGKWLDAVDPRLCKMFDKKQAKALMMAGLWCVHPIASSRPKIAEAMAVLTMEAPTPNLPLKMPSSPYDIDQKVRRGCFGF